MNPPENGNNNSESLPNEERVARFFKKYNVKAKFNRNNWSQRTEFSGETNEVLKGAARSDAEARELVGLGNNHFEQLAGYLVDKYSLEKPVLEMHIGEAATPVEIKALTFLGEAMDDDEMVGHKINHEMGHVAIYYEMVEALKTLYLDQDITQAVGGLYLNVQRLRRSDRPLSKLEDLDFYNEGELFYEDLAEAYAIKFGGDERWESYQRFLLSGAPQNRQAASEVIKVVNKLYEYSIIS